MRGEREGGRGGRKGSELMKKIVMVETSCCFRMCLPLPPLPLSPFPPSLLLPSLPSLLLLLPPSPSLSPSACQNQSNEAPHCWAGARGDPPSLAGLDTILWNVQGDLPTLKADSQSRLLSGKMTIVFLHNLCEGVRV